MQYLSGASSLADVEDWFVPVLWDIESQDEHTRELAGTVHILISEFSRGDRSSQGVREGLAAIVRTSDVPSLP